MKMKKRLILVLIVLMAFGLVILSGCSKAEKPAETEVEKEESEEEPEESTEAEEAAGKGSSEDNTLPADFIGEYWFSSGAGGWGTYMQLSEDGTVLGSYHDSEMGESGDDYPNGTVYISNFSGRFTDFVEIDQYTWSAKFTDLSLEYSVNEEWIEEGVRFVATEPYGINGGEDYILIAKGAPKDILAEMDWSWIYGITGTWMDDVDAIPEYLIMNTETRNIFVQSTYQ